MAKTLNVNVNLETKVLVFDMDGTIADLYGVDGWLEKLRASDPTPYIEADPLWDMVELVATLNALRNIGYIVAITSWLSMESTPEYSKAVRTAKKNWLDGHHFPYDELHMVKFGTTKANCTRHYECEQILFDDSEKVRNGWTLGETVNPTTTNIIDYLKALL
jgi:hypothetical protein